MLIYVLCYGTQGVQFFWFGGLGGWLVGWLAGCWLHQVGGRNL